MRRILVLLTAVFLMSPVVAQDRAFNRFTDELTQTLESDAATVLTRGLFVDFANKVCARTEGAPAISMEREAQAWQTRNERYIRASTTALNEIGSRLLAEGGEEMRQGYFYSIRDASVKQVVGALKRLLNGANLDNAVAPLPEQCLTEADRLRSRTADIRNSPNLTRALLPYMERRGLARD